MILLDTGFLIELLSEREEAVMKAHKIDAELKAISSVTLYELAFRSNHSNPKGKIQKKKKRRIWEKGHEKELFPHSTNNSTAIHAA